MFCSILFVRIYYTSYSNNIVIIMSLSFSTIHYAAITIGFVDLTDYVLEDTPGYIEILVEVKGDVAPQGDAVVVYATDESSASNSASSKCRPVIYHCSAMLHQ